MIKLEFHWGLGKGRGGGGGRLTSTNPDFSLRFVRELKMY